MGTPNFMFQHGNSFMKSYSFTEQRKSSIKVSLRWTGGYIREVVTARWGKLFSRPRVLPDDSLSSGAGRRQWSAKLIGSKMFLAASHRMLVLT